jgi:hypothetical protein
MTTLNDILALIPMEDQWIYVFDTEGNEYYEGFKGNLELSEEGEGLISAGFMGMILIRKIQTTASCRPSRSR